MELATFNSEVSTGEFTCVKPEPRKQVAHAKKEKMRQRKLYISLHSDVKREVQATCFRILHPTRHNAPTLGSGSGVRIRVAWWKEPWPDLILCSANGRRVNDES